MKELKIVGMVVAGIFFLFHVCFGTPLKECFFKFVEIAALGIAFTWATSSIQEGRKEAAKEALEEYERDRARN